MFGAIDISWVDSPYISSTCAVMDSIVDSALIYIMVVKEILFVPLHRSFYFVEGLHCRPILKEHGLYMTERTQKAFYNLTCLCFVLTLLIIQQQCIKTVVEYLYR
jgi:hypothetical protein